VGVLVFTLGERSKMLRELAHMKKWRSLKLEDAVQWLPVMPLDLKFPVRKPKKSIRYKLCFMGWDFGRRQAKNKEIAAGIAERSL
jgi:hypothetical protein